MDSRGSMPRFKLPLIPVVRTVAWSLLVGLTMALSPMAAMALLLVVLALVFLLARL
jgi:hypothetical protein